jgi:hypothetical protein
MSMAQVKTKEAADDHQQPTAPPPQATAGEPSATATLAPFVSEAELRAESASAPLGGCDVEHCKRMHE